MELKWRFLTIFWKLVALVRLQHPGRRWQVLVGGALAASCCGYLLLLQSAAPPDRAAAFRLVQKQLRDSIGNGSEEVGCQFPVLDPYSEEAMRFSREVPQFTCPGEDWAACYFSECRVKSDILARYRDISCVYKDIIYVNDNYYYTGEPSRVVGTGVYRLNRSDQVKVSCRGIDKAGLGLVSSRWYGNLAGLRPLPRRAPPGRQRAPNVMIIAFDSTSRYGFMRKMPRSHKVLTEELKATVLKGFHVLGDGTPGTLFPLLSGRSELEHPDTRRRLGNRRQLDPELFTLRAMARHGYVTMYLEDMPWVGAFQYRYNGFSGAPADHYLFPFFMEETGYGAKLLTMSKYCVGSQRQYRFMLNLTNQLMETPGKKYSFTFIGDISHDDFNMISTADHDFAEYLRAFRSSGKVKDTLLIVMGDHGSRFSPIRETYQGKIEERLPLMAVILPDLLMQERPQALKALRGNTDVLTTPFDVHTTVLDAMGLRHLANDFKVPGSNLPRGMSFLEPIPRSRSCGQAAILRHWCVCARWDSVAVTDPMHGRVAALLAQFVNNITAERRDVCAERGLTSVSWVLRGGTNEEVLRFKRGRDAEGLYAGFMTHARAVRPHREDYQAKIVMSPGRAVYEGSMKYHVREDRFTISEAEISRITAYKDEPKCVSKTHPHLNKYCYCKSSAIGDDKDGSFDITRDVH